MRRLTLVVVVLMGVLLLLWLGLRGSGSLTAGDTPSPGREPGRRAGLELQPERPEDVGARGGADAGSTPSLVVAPTEAEGVLEVEVLAGERPMPGANVRLYWRGARDPRLDEMSWRLASTATTDARGRARLSSRPGGYLIAVHAEGHAPLRRPVSRPHGEARTSLRLVLERGHSLTGRTVVAGTNEPLPLVELVLTAHGGRLDRGFEPDAPAEERVYATSNERGEFRVEGLSSGTYMLDARAPGQTREVLLGVELPAKAPLTVALERAGVIEGFVVDAEERPVADAEVMVSGPTTPRQLTTGEGGGFSAEVSTGSYLLSARHGAEAGSVDKLLFVRAGQTVRDVRIRLGRGAVLEGRVLARATGAPVEGARVSVRPTGRPGDAGSGVTDRAGLFALKGLASGGYDLVVHAPGYSRLSRRGLMVAAGERFPLELQLEGMGTVEGQVRDAAGAPLPGVRVVGGLRWAGGWGSAAESRTDADGHYHLEGLAIGRVDISALSEGADLGVSQSVDVKAGEMTRVDLTLQRTGTLEGVVRTARGSPPSKPLEVSAYSLTTPSSSSPRPERIALDPSGRFRMVLPQGSYHVLVSSHVEPPMREVKVEAGRTVQTELTLPEDSGDVLRIKGLVLEPDGTPSPHAWLMLSLEGFQGGRGSGAFVDGEGRFSFSHELEDAKARLFTATARNGGRMGETQQLVKRGEQEVVVRLRPGTSVRGQVVRRDGQPVRGFVLAVRLPGLKYLAGLDTLEFPGDRFELSDVPDEPVTLSVRTLEGAIGEVHLSPSVGTTAEVTVSVESGATVRGRVVDAATNVPLAGVFVLIRGQALRSSRTSADGRFTLENLSSGEDSLEFLASGVRLGQRPVKLVPGQSLDVGDIPVESRRAPDAGVPW
ncbi:hypothetical protein CYFUS_001621 [Cystobacter fuscus]|uniref:Carboxypeptidase regulatory-like domain-containing protein n=1 Tax=Cystobacter fuscus TaxID=43 RepID=A0A250IYB9_9BACT|nr:carboxypeptidase-like regulatory domain-containing protein [Cystobacter fuscus]ATB36207.1 hypothetical protein CYFUS_001621 [Cystobacter fuscus]